MVNESYANVLFGLTTIAMLLASIQHSAYISSNLELAEKYYFNYNIGIIITCIFANICLGIFALFILGNLGDFIQKMNVNLIGARQKLRVLACLILTSLMFYSGSNLVCFMKDIVLLGMMKKMAVISLFVCILQVLEIMVIGLIHPDVFGFKLIKEIKSYDSGKKTKVHYL